VAEEQRRAPSPVEIEIARIDTDVREAIADEDAPLTINALMALFGGHSYSFIILAFCVLNMIPGPPGYGGTVALVIALVALAMVRHRPVRLPRLIGERRVSPRFVVRMLDRLRWLAGLIGRLSRPNMVWLTGPQTSRPIGLLIMVLCLPMMVPIPFMNAIPNVGLTIICISRLNQNGLGVVLGIAIAALGVVFDVWLVVTVVSFALSAAGWGAA
jgi:hypothetical protein